MPRKISPEAARRYLVLRHFLAPPRSLPAEPGSVMRVFDRLGSVQFDPLDIAGRNHDLVLNARVSGNRRVYDLVERLFPPDLLAERHPIDEQRRHKLLSRYRAHGLLGPAGSGEVWLGTGPRAVDRPPQRQLLVAEGKLAAVQIEGRR